MSPYGAAGAVLDPRGRCRGYQGKMEVSMMEHGMDMVKWRNEEIRNYREYLKSLSPDSKEYKLISQGIEQLERIVL